MPSFRVAEKLKRRFQEQDGKCYWCGRQTALSGTPTREIAKMFGVEIGSPNWRRRARDHTATAEHLIPRSEGGTDKWANIVMACRACNSARGNDLDWVPMQEAAE